MLGALEMMSEQLHRLTFAMPVADDSENHKIHTTLVFAQVHVCCFLLTFDSQCAMRRHTLQPINRRVRES